MAAAVSCAVGHEACTSVTVFGTCLVCCAVLESAQFALSVAACVAAYARAASMRRRFSPHACAACLCQMYNCTSIVGPCLCCHLLVDDLVRSALCRFLSTAWSPIMTFGFADGWSIVVVGLLSRLDCIRVLHACAAARCKACCGTDNSADNKHATVQPGSVHYGLFGT